MMNHNNKTHSDGFGEEGERIDYIPLVESCPNSFVRMCQK